MKLNKIMLASVMAFGVVAGAQAAGNGAGTVTFTGSIIDAPCSITPETVDQTVELGQISKAQLETANKTGTSNPRPFQIKLENCDTATLKTVTTTFTGASSQYDKDLLGMTGTATGASIAITDGSGKKIALGQATDAQTLQDGNNTLSFAAFLQGGGASATINPGEFQSIADFSLAYQ